MVLALLEAEGVCCGFLEKKRGFYLEKNRDSGGFRIGQNVVHAKFGAGVKWLAVANLQTG